MLENIPQSIVVVQEMVLLRKSVNFVQASNPLISIAMIYKAMGPFIGWYIYQLITEKDIFDLIIVYFSMVFMILP